MRFDVGLNNFITNTDYGTLKNDTQSNTLSVTVADNTTWNPSVDNILAQSTLVVGTVNAGIRARGKSSKYAPWVVGTTLYSTINYEIPSLAMTGLTMNLYCNLERVSSTTVRLTMASEGSVGSPDFRTEEAQTITFVFSTFLSPFDN
jgi:hypothetical protein